MDQNKIKSIVDSVITEKKLCPKGRAYYNRRIAAGEVPSAYLSGRAVKVCKGLMEGDEETVECENCGWEWNLEDGGKEPFVCHKCGHDNVEKYDMNESLRDWFQKEDWVRIDTQGNITGPCGTMKKGQATTRCLPRAKANSLTKAERAATARKKANADRKGDRVVPNTDKAKVRLKEDKYDNKGEGAGYDLIKQNPFNIQKLVDKGIIFIGLPGDGEGGIGKHKEKGDASIITLYNLKALPPDPWMVISAKNPIPTDIPYIQKGQYKLFYNGKYNQILWGIEKKGLKPEDFYLNVKEAINPLGWEPIIKAENEEIERTAGELGLPYDVVYNSFVNGDEVTLTDEMWSRLENTDSYDINSEEEAIELAQYYGKDIQSILVAEKTPPALILQYSPNKYYLVGGNTRLMVARAKGINPQVILATIEPSNKYAYQDVNDIGADLTEEYDVENEEDYEGFIMFMKEYSRQLTESKLTEAEYRGRKVQLGKIMQGDIKKFKVYVKNAKGKVVKVNFGFGGKSAKGKRMVIKAKNPKRRAAYRARHNCSNPGPRWKANYWSCKKW
jgi:hypothetical protein